MSARILILLVQLVGLGYNLVIMRLADRQRKRPLPTEVADIYKPARYRQYLDYVADHRKAALLYNGVSLALLIALYCSDMFRAIEALAGGNPYWIFLATHGVFLVVETIVDTIRDYHDRFVIEEKYGMNRQSRKDFARDAMLGLLQQIFVIAGMGLLLAFIGEHLSDWTQGFSVTFPKALIFSLAIAAAIFAFVLLASLLSIWILKRQYTFTPMPDGALRSKIMALQEGAKKQVRKIYIYDESKKSTTKNAFLLKLLWHREFGVADNFLSENSQEELLAVLSHEIGHLKHKKNLLNYLQYAGIVLLFSAMTWLIYRPDLLLRLNAWIRSSFGISVNNYYVWVSVLSALLTPVMKIAGVFNNYRSRQEEYEADREAVRNGYGEAMIATFKRLSSDELVNVNPHPCIEFLEYDHPGMYRRIRAIREAEVRMQSTPGRGTA